LGALKHYLIFIFLASTLHRSYAQVSPFVSDSAKGFKGDTIGAVDTILVRDIDLIDVARKVFTDNKEVRQPTEENKTSKLHISGVPAAGYTLQTGFAGVLSANGAFYTSPCANTSNVLTSFTYTVRNQIIFPVQTTIWTPGNKYNIFLDWRYLYFPSYTYGLGQFTTLADGYMIEYSTIHMHQTLQRKFRENIYAGLGYNMDYYWNIKELDPPANVKTDFQNYGLSSTEFASGITFNFLYDDRKNSINPDKGNFLNVIYRPNLTFLGNSATWRSMVIDWRKYINLPAGSRNTLAFWSYEWFTLSGKPPYLMLPSTGSDPYTNTGRGYIQGRYRGDNMLYGEGEYRFSITNNGFLGGVLFGNLQAFGMAPKNQIQTLIPGWGAGIRLRLNKFSKTNVALDYGFGANGSGGVFVNLGEVF